jgi:hypothetical protein
MTPGFDIFQTEADGGVLWRGAAATMDEARGRIRELAAQSPGEYFVLNFATGSKIIVEPGSVHKTWEGNVRCSDRRPQPNLALSDGCAD